jgi:pyruvate,water dikinase
MSTQDQGDLLLRTLRERAKELNCLYLVDEVLQDGEAPVATILSRVVAAIPGGWYAPDSCHACIEYDGATYHSPGFQPLVQELSEPLPMGDSQSGTLRVGYSVEEPELDTGPFLNDEVKLVRTLAARIGQGLLHRQLEPLFRSANGRSTEGSGTTRDSWRAVVEMLRLTDQELFGKVVRKLLNHLCYLGIDDARAILQRLDWPAEEDKAHDGINRATRRRAGDTLKSQAEVVLHIAQAHLPAETLYRQCQTWIMDHRVDNLLDVLEDSATGLADIVHALDRFMASGVNESDLSLPTSSAVRVSLVRRFLSRRLEFIKLAKDLVSISDFCALGHRLIYPQRSNGYIGGKGAGLFVAMQVVQREAANHKELQGIKCPKTWYLTSDAVLDFVHQNHLEELLEHKYRDIAQIRLEYPNLVALFKNSAFSSQIQTGLSMALDDFSDRPLVVRSSSLLEDGAGAAFSGKYKSLFVANQGPKKLRLEALMDAIAEVYASMYGPDPIQYRKERGLLDFPEEMGILIQEVVGKRVGKYLLPAYAGVALSRNEFRWSPRIKTNDGLLRLVPGLGTRAVDRVGEDYPVLIAPGQPRLRVNASMDDTVRYSPRFIDVINLESNTIETVSVTSLLSYCGNRMPGLRQVYSRIDSGMLQSVTGLYDPEVDTLIPTFETLLNGPEFVSRMRFLLQTLEEQFGGPVDLEFAADEDDFYLLQCRPQSAKSGVGPVQVPHGVPRESLLFEANHNICQSRVEGITHVVNVSAKDYDALSSIQELRAVGQIIGRLNDLLPKRHFILIGPGRWGSRGDIKLGVNVTYSDISNTAALVEVALRRGNYQPDLSFGTHFFQDLVEAEIAYVPLYPHMEGQFFAQDFLASAPNLLASLLPDAAHLAHVVHVVDIPSNTSGLMLEILGDGDEGRAVGRFVPPPLPGKGKPQDLYIDKTTRFEGADHWLWRQRMADRLAIELDGSALGVVALYLFGSTKNATAGPDSDLDLIVHIRGTDQQRRELSAWLDGWSKSLDEANFLRTGKRQGDLLDIHYVTDADLAARTSFAARIGALSDAARPLLLKCTVDESE